MVESVSVQEDQAAVHKDCIPVGIAGTVRREGGLEAIGNLLRELNHVLTIDLGR